MDTEDGDYGESLDSGDIADTPEDVGNATETPVSSGAGNTIEMQAAVAPPPLPRPKSEPGGVDLLAVLGIVWTAELVLGLAIVAMMIANEGIESLAGGFSPEGWHIVAITPVSAVITILACWYFACKRYGKRFSEGLYFRTVPWHAVRVSILTGLVGAGVVCVLMMLFSTGESLIAELIARPAPGQPDKVQLHYPLLLLFVLVPFLEELYYRGFLFTVFGNLLGVWWAFGIIVVWFGAVHAPQLTGDPVGIPIIMAVGAVFTWFRFKYDSIIPAMACHVTYNAALVLFSIVQVYVHNSTV